MTSEPSPWTLARIWDALTKLWAIVVATTILGSGIAYVDSASTTPVYSSTSTLSFSISQGTTAADLANGAVRVQTLRAHIGTVHDVTATEDAERIFQA